MNAQNEEIKISCPHCGQHLIIDGTMLGMELECPTCVQPFLAVPPDAADAVMDKGPQPETELSVHSSGRRRVLVIAAAATVFVLIAGILVFAIRPGSKPTEETRAPKGEIKSDALISRSNKEPSGSGNRMSDIKGSNKSQQTTEATHPQLSAKDLCDEFYDALIAETGDPNYYRRVSDTCVGFVPEGENPPFINKIEFSVDSGHPTATIIQDITFFAKAMMTPNTYNPYRTYGPRFTSVQALIHELESEFEQRISSFPSEENATAKAFLDDNGHLIAVGTIRVAPGKCLERFGKLWEAMGRSRTYFYG